MSAAGEAAARRARDVARVLDRVKSPGQAFAAATEAAVDARHAAQMADAKLSRWVNWFGGYTRSGQLTLFGSHLAAMQRVRAFWAARQGGAFLPGKWVEQRRQIAAVYVDAAGLAAVVETAEARGLGSLEGAIAAAAGETVAVVGSAVKVAVPLAAVALAVLILAKTKG